MKKNKDKGHLHRLTLIALALLSTVSAPARTAGNVDGSGVWYAGFEGGVPFGISTFSSFGADKMRAGFGLGVFGGYRFSPILSLETTAKWGKTSLSARQCCIDVGYWLGTDGIRYYAPVLGMEGSGYSGLKSSVALQRYGLRLNVNVLGFFTATKNSRWTVELSPEVSAIGSKATIKTISANSEMLKGSSEWHLGFGGNLQVGCRFNDNLGLGVYTGLTRLTGSRIDGVPKHLHKDNYLWESGIRLLWSFGSKKKTTAVQTHVETIAPAQPTERPMAKLEEETAQTPTLEQKVDTAVTATPSKETTSEVKDSLPTIYFRFNSVKIPYGELHKVDEIVNAMKADAGMKIAIDGWCDTRGAKAVNNRMPLQRAQALKWALMRRGISDDRMVSVKGTPC